MRLLVTGAAGFIGSSYVRLVGDDHDVVVLDKLTYAGRRENLPDDVELVVGAIEDRELVRQVADGADAIVNFAAESHVDRSIADQNAFARTHVIGTSVLLDAVRECGVSRYLQVSTDEVYGSVSEGASVESDALDPRSPYSAAKAAGELLARAYHATYGLDVVITRGSNTYGPRQHPEKLVALFITNALADQPLPMYGDGLQRRDWLFVDDHADAVGVALDRGTAGDCFNVPGGDELTNRDVTAAILAQLDKPWSLVRSVPDRPGHDRRYAMDGGRIRARGWAPRVSFDEGIGRTVRWYVENEPWWRSIRDSEWADYYGKQYGWRLERSVPA